MANSQLSDYFLSKFPSATNTTSLASINILDKHLIKKCNNTKKNKTTTPKLIALTKKPSLGTQLLHVHEL